MVLSVDIVLILGGDDGDHIFAQCQAVNTGPWCSVFSFLIIATRETGESTVTCYVMEIVHLDFDLCTPTGL